MPTTLLPQQGVLVLLTQGHRCLPPPAGLLLHVNSLDRLLLLIEVAEGHPAAVVDVRRGVRPQLDGLGEVLDGFFYFNEGGGAGGVGALVCVRIERGSGLTDSLPRCFAVRPVAFSDVPLMRVRCVPGMCQSFCVPFVCPIPSRAHAAQTDTFVMNKE